MEGTDEFVGLEEAAERGVAQDLVGAVREAAVRVGQQGPVLVRQEEPRGDSVHPEAVAELQGQLPAKVLRPGGDGGLRAAVAGDARQRPERRLRTEIDNGSDRKSVV